MKTTLTQETDSTVRLAVEATSDEVAPAIDRAVRGLADQVKIPGFRKGKVPRQILETRLGKDAIREATLREAVPELLAKAVESETISPIAPPSVEIKEYDLGADLTFDAVVEVRPEIKLPDLAGIPLTKRTRKATEEEIDEQLERLRERFASLETVERPVRRGDFALINLTTTHNDTTIDELSAADQLYEVGSGFIVPDLDDQLENARAGEILKFNATVPDEVGGEMAGREVTFTVLLKEVKHKVMPALDDEFAKTASEFDTLAELRADVASRIEAFKEGSVDAEIRSQLLEHVLDEVEFSPPPTLIEEEMAYRLQRLEEQLRGARMTLDSYLEASGTTEEQLENDLRQQAERNVRAQMILEEISRREAFQVTEDELREEVRHHAEALRMDAKALQERFADPNRMLALAGDIIRRKALNHLVAQADITDEDAADEPSETPDPSVEAPPEEI